jgi:hypothetical protein
MLPTTPDKAVLGKSWGYLYFSTYFSRPLIMVSFLVNWLLSSCPLVVHAKHRWLSNFKFLRISNA